MSEGEGRICFSELGKGPDETGGGYGFDGEIVIKRRKFRLKVSHRLRSSHSSLLPKRVVLVGGEIGEPHRRMSLKSFRGVWGMCVWEGATESNTDNECLVSLERKSTFLLFGRSLNDTLELL